MKHSRNRWLAAILLAAWSGIGMSSGDVSQVAVTTERQAPSSAISLACSPDKPTVWPREEIGVRAWLTRASSSPRFTWTATAGQIIAHDAEARWNFAGVAPGTYTATVRVTQEAGPPLECVVRGIVQPLPAGRGRESGWAILVSGRNEELQYGLYSYLLLGSPPTDTSRERYRKTIEAYVSLIPAVTALEQYLPRRELNITYLPLTILPIGARLSSDWALEHYDYARARALLGKLSGNYRDGPYIISSALPLTTATARSEQHLLQDLSRTPPHLAALWAREFFNQAAQERFWQEQTTARRLALNLRTMLAVLASGLPDVLAGVDERIAWIR